MMKIHPYRLAFLLLLSLNLHVAAVAQPSSFYYALEFTENKGQWGDRFQYRSEVGTGAFFLHPDGFTVLQHDERDYKRVMEMLHGHNHSEEENTMANASGPGKQPGQDGFSMRSHAYRVTFEGANKDTRPEGEKVVQTDISYFLGNDPSAWKSGVSSYQVITYRNVYPKIDIRYYSEAGRLKYDIIARPGADISAIRMRYEGAEGLGVVKGQLVVKTSVGETRELEPYTYQITGSEKKEVSCAYNVKGDVVTFSVRNHDRTRELIIDPTLVFGTFTGSRSSNWGYTATPGPDGSFFAGGIVFGTGYPISTGAFQGTYRGGNVDIGITRFKPDGSGPRMYSTYVGGDGDDVPHSLIADRQGNLVILGRTTSSNYPTTGSNVGTRGATDIIVTKINAAGTALIGSVVMGGSGPDGANIDGAITPANCTSLLYNYGDNARSEVILDDANNVYIAASTESSNFPVVNAVQPTRGGNQDAVVIKMSPNLNTVLFSTYLGGSADDAGFVLKLHPVTGDIYVAGATSSLNFPGNKTGVIQPAFQGQIDGYIAVLSNDGSNLIRSTYLATAATDIIYGIQFDKVGFPYVMGISLGNWPVLNAAYSNPGAKQFISKLKADLSGYEYSTVYGSASAIPNISPVAFLVDRCENVYVSGWGGKLNPCSGNSCFDLKTAGPAGMPITPDAIKPVTDNRDFYFIVLEKNVQKLLYGSFAGQSGGEGDHVDGGTSRFDSRGAIYQAVCANCGGNSVCPTAPITVPFPTTPGVVAPVNGALGSNSSGECNLGAIKISFDFDGIQSGLQVSTDGVINDTSGCVPLRVDFSDTLAMGQSYIWDFGDGSPRITTTIADTSHTYTAPGLYKVMLIAVDNTKCIPTDTSYRFVRVRVDKAIPDFNPVKLPPCESLAMRFDNLSVAPPGKPFANNSFVWDFGDGSPRVTAGSGPVTRTFASMGSYTVKLILNDTSYCNGPDSISRVVRLAPTLSADFSSSEDSACVPFSVQFENKSTGGQTFRWDFGDGTSFTGSTPPAKRYTSAGVYTVTMIATDPNTCNVTDTTQQKIYAVGGPIAAFTYNPFPSIENTPTNFINGSIDASRYTWSFGDGKGSTLTNPIHQFTTSGINTVCLIAVNDLNCADTVCQPVQSIVVAALDVPNAFTPNGDGVNDKVFVRGFGIVKMNFRIYNRWGQLVFQSTDPAIGWDGIFKGRIQPMDAFGYILDVEFNTGERVTKKGDITLLR